MFDAELRSTEEPVAKAKHPDRVDPAWPGEDDLGKSPVSEVAADRQGALSPFGDLVFPLSAEELGYQHPETEINR
jgi:hypothetical protein